MTLFRAEACEGEGQVGSLTPEDIQTVLKVRLLEKNKMLKLQFSNYDFKGPTT